MTPTLDPYVLGLAVLAAPCFGYHERGNATCGDCPVASRCVEARAMRAVTVAGQLAKAARAATRAAKAPKPDPIPTPAPTGESIDDILAAIERVPAGANTSAYVPPTPAPSPADPSGDGIDLTSLFGDLLAPEPAAPPPAPVAPPPPAPRVTPMKAVIDSVCFVCNGRIPAKSNAEFIPGKGLRHTTCPPIGST